MRNVLSYLNQHWTIYALWFVAVVIVICLALTLKQDGVKSPASVSPGTNTTQSASPSQTSANPTSPIGKRLMTSVRRGSSSARSWQAPRPSWARISQAMTSCGYSGATVSLARTYFMTHAYSPTQSIPNCLKTLVSSAHHTHHKAHGNTWDTRATSGTIHSALVPSSRPSDLDLGSTARDPLMMRH